jgi:hypothetical protein
VDKAALEARLKQEKEQAAAAAAAAAAAKRAATAAAAAPATPAAPAPTAAASGSAAGATPLGKKEAGMEEPPAAANPPSCTVRVDGFVRPFRLPAAEKVGVGAVDVFLLCFCMSYVGACEIMYMNM